MLGPSRAACYTTACGETLQAGDIIVPPSNAATVSISDLKISRIGIVSKKPNPFRPGFWDVEIKYVFTYILTFRNGDCGDICCVPANSIYKAKVTLFGSIGGDIVMASDLYDSDCTTTNMGPYVTVEAKAVALAAELKYPNNCNNFAGCGCNTGCGTICGCSCDCGCDCDCGCNTNCGCGCDCNCDCDCGCGCGDNCAPIANSVLVTIGLFAIVKIFRPVNILVESSGYCVPEECAQSSGSCSPCDFFDSIEFPLNIFSPPGSCEFLKGKSEKSVPPKKNNSCFCK